MATKIQTEAPTFGRKAKVQPKPQLACLGKITSVGEVKEPQDGGFYHHIPIEITPTQSGLKTVLRLLFWPEMFTADPEEFKYDSRLKKGQNAQNDENRSRHFVYAKNYMNDNDDAYFQVLAGDKLAAVFEALKGAWNDGRVEPVEFRKIIASVIAGKDIAYILRQGTEVKDGGIKALTERYEISQVVPYTKEAVQGLIDRAKKTENAKKVENQLKLTFTLSK